MMARRHLFLNVDLINGPMDDESDGLIHDMIPPFGEHNNNHNNHMNNINNINNPNTMMNDSIISTTFRHDGFSIGRDFVRMEGKTLSRGDFGPSLITMEHTLGRGACSRVVKGVYHHHHHGNDERVSISKPQERSNNKSNKKNDENENGSSQTMTMTMTTTPVALKQFPIQSTQHKHMMSKELSILHRMDCDCLVRLMGAFYSEHVVTLVLEYMDSGTLEHLLLQQCQQEQRQLKLLPNTMIAAIAYQMLWGLSYLHFEGCLHRDLKPSNVLLHSNGSVKLSDFGISSSSFTPSSSDPTTTITTTPSCIMNTTVVGTQKYMALERLHGEPYGTPADIWSLGLILYQCVTGQELFHDIQSIVELVVTLEDEQEEHGFIHDIATVSCTLTRQVLEGCLQIAPQQRMPARVILKAPWFTKVGIESIADAQQINKDYLSSIIL